MSASTVSITANPAARRRPVLANEKKSNIEMVPAEPTLSGAIVGADKATAGQSKDLSHHSIRGEATRDLLQAKKPALAHNSTVSPRRTRKASSKTEKPRWLTVLSIFTKNLVLLLVMAGLVQMIWRLVLRSGESSMLGTNMGLSEIESRIAEVESFVKTTAKMIQVQVDVVDRRIDSEVGGLRRDLNNKIEDQRSILQNALENLQDKSKELENFMNELKNVNWLTKEEFERIYEELKNSKGESGENENNLSLDGMKAYAREILEKEIEKHAADGLGRVDYALASGGAMVVSHSEPYLAGKRSNWFLIGSRNVVRDDANKMLKPSFGEPGQCFPLKGSSGFVQIKLRTTIIPEAVTLEHVAKSVAYDRSSAPKYCRVSGWLQGHEDTAVDARKMYLLAEFTYDLEKSNAQTFNVLSSADTGVIDTVRLDFTSNHGSPTHTCIYRFRVHGYEPGSVSMMTMQR
ncbi:hypothetical protein SLEP1_g47428 [Rubroshorea leprosula]|uniref:SUN domain-containing protein n=1 Tax=Rubroshorea leprosula TaxID=152421 RepID=A0AAV5LT51_9ROSI|nr:hypothetical protein SLEP1_g47428 [Rubroshorea leprosula]